VSIYRFSPSAAEGCPFWWDKRAPTSIKKIEVWICVMCLNSRLLALGTTRVLDTPGVVGDGRLRSFPLSRPRGSPRALRLVVPLRTTGTGEQLYAPKTRSSGRAVETTNATPRSASNPPASEKERLSKILRPWS